MTDRSLPVMILDGGLPQPVLSAFETGTVAGLRRELAFLAATIDRQRAQLDACDQMLARYCQTIDTQRALIEELERDRDQWQARARGEGTRPAFPATALNRQWTPVV